MSSIYLGIDIGTTSAKCLAVGDDGETLALAQHPYPMAHPRQGWAEQDPEDYWRGLVDVVNRCVRDCIEKGYSADDIAALAMSTQGDTLIITDELGSPVAPALSWMDGRAEAECRELLAETGASFWYGETGQPLTPLSSACKIRWIARNAPDLRQENARFCWVADFLAKRLCGDFAADIPSASWTPLFSPARRTWSADVLRVLGVPDDVLPIIMESGAVIGELLPEAAAELHVGPRVRLVAGAFDQAAAAHGAGASAAGRSVLSCGTAWVLYSVSASPVLDEAERLCICCHTAASEWGLVLPFTGGSAYDWLHRTLGNTAGGAESQSEPLIFIPHLYGGLSPDWRQESKGSLLGLTMSHTQEDIRVALMRGIACEARRNLEAAETLCGRIESVRMVGGAGRSETWPQIIANVLNRPVEISECVESACYGAAKLAAQDASTQWRGAQCVRSFVPVAGDVELEERLYRRYLRSYEALLPAYESKAEEGAEH